MVQSLQCPNCGASVPPDQLRCSYCRSVLSRTACSTCFGPIFRGMKYCPACGNRVMRRDLVVDQKLHCPRCEVQLLPALIADVRVDECDQCGGLWLDRQAFQEICEKWDVTALPADDGTGVLNPAHSAASSATNFTTTPAPDLQTGTPALTKSRARMYIPCPACGELMLRKNFAGCSGVIIDWCKPHGYWFDRRELQQVVAFIRSGGMARSREKDLSLLREEQDRLRAMQAQPLPGSIDPRVDSVSELFGLDSDWVETVSSLIRKFFG